MYIVKVPIVVAIIYLNNTLSKVYPLYVLLVFQRIVT